MRRHWPAVVTLGQAAGYETGKGPKVDHGSYQLAGGSHLRRLLVGRGDFDREVAVGVHVALLKTNHQCVDPTWLAAMLNTPYCYAQSQKYTHGITNQDLGLTRMVKISMYLPPVEKQRQYANVLKCSKAMRERLKESRRVQEDLFNSVVQRAFRGEL